MRDHSCGTKSPGISALNLILILFWGHFPRGLSENCSQRAVIKRYLLRVESVSVPLSVGSPSWWQGQIDSIARVPTPGRILWKYQINAYHIDIRTDRFVNGVSLRRQRREEIQIIHRNDQRHSYTIDLKQNCGQKSTFIDGLACGKYLSCTNEPYTTLGAMRLPRKGVKIAPLTMKSISNPETYPSWPRSAFLTESEKTRMLRFWGSREDMCGNEIIVPRTCRYLSLRACATIVDRVAVGADCFVRRENSAQQGVEVIPSHHIEKLRESNSLDSIELRGS